MDHNEFLPVTQHPNEIKRNFSKVAKDALEHIKGQVAVTTTEESVKKVVTPVKKVEKPTVTVETVVATRREIKNFIKNL